MKEMEGAEESRSIRMSDVQCSGSAHYKMILVNYFRAMSYHYMAGVDSNVGCLPFSLEHRETEGWSSPGQSLDDEPGVAPFQGSCKGGTRLARTPSWRLLAFSAIVAVAPGP